MTNTRYYKATFADGTVKIRSTVSRFYTHAWKFTYTPRAYPAFPDRVIKPVERFGFSTSATQAAANLNSEQRAWGGRDGEVTTAVPSTKKGEPVLTD